jgi:hypothetical protein
MPLMRTFYHFTRAITLPSVARDGLDNGSVFVTPFHYVRGVWLTTSRSPEGHGLENANMGCKKEVRIEIGLEESDAKLERYLDWAKRVGLDRRWMNLLLSKRRLSPETWWVYFGVIGTGAFREIRNMTSNAPLQRWEVGEIKRGEMPKGRWELVSLAAVEAGRVDLRYSTYEAVRRILE